MSWIKDVRSSLARLNHDKKTLRKFIITIALALLLLATISYFFAHHLQQVAVLSSFAFVLLVAARVFPQKFKLAHIVWMALAFSLGYFMSRIILTLLFYLIITPMGLAMRLFGKDLIDKRIEKNKESYWIKRKNGSDGLERVYHQF